MIVLIISIEGGKKESKMPDKKVKEKNNEISRREFLKDAGLVVGGATLGSMGALAGCSGNGNATQTVTKTVTSGGTSTTTVTATGPGASSTITVTSPAQTTSIPGLITLSVNGQNYNVTVQPDWSLAWVLREKLGLLGVKIGCDRGECGSCTVHVDGRTNFACMWLAVDAVGKNIITIEGLASGPTLHKAQQNFLDAQSFQCGFCTPGMIMSAAALLNKYPKPTLDQVKLGMSGNLCYCGDHTRIVNAVMKGG